MKLDDATIMLLLKGFQTRLKEHGEKMRSYTKSLNDNDLSNANIYWKEAEEIEKELIEVLINILEEIKDR